MPILVYFKEPAISLVLGGELNKETIARLDNERLGPILVMSDPDGKKQILFPRSDLDITYMKEITVEEWEQMKARNEDMQRQREAAAAKGLGRITPAQFSGVRPKGPGGKGN